jgi:hypothetical protein
MDRIEPVLRRWGRRAKGAWVRASMPAKAAVITFAVGLAGLAAFGAYRVFLA